MAEGLRQPGFIAAAMLADQDQRSVETFMTLQPWDGSKASLLQCQVVGPERLETGQDATPIIGDLAISLSTKGTAISRLYLELAVSPGQRAGKRLERAVGHDDVRLLNRVIKKKRAQNGIRARFDQEIFRSLFCVFSADFFS